MKRLALKKQHGAVLAFSLVMLLLLTLVSISMIRQNKAQINIASNAGQQIKAFAVVETALRQTQAILEPLRYQDQATKHCKSGASNQVHEEDVLTGLPTGINAVVKGVYCISNYVNHGTVDHPQFSGDEFRCNYNPDGTRDAQPLTNTAATGNQHACGRLNNSGGWTDGTANVNACQIELYTLNVTMTDAATNAQRTVESKFEIDCSNDLNAHNAP